MPPLKGLFRPIMALPCQAIIPTATRPWVRARAWFKCSLPPTRKLGYALVWSTSAVLVRLTNSSLGSISEHLNDSDGAIHGYEQALRQNPYSAPALLAIANILRGRDQFAQAIEYLKAITKFDERNGEVWATLGKHISA